MVDRFDPRVVDPATPRVPVLEVLLSVVRPVTERVPPIVVFDRTARPYAPTVENTDSAPCTWTEL
jgi:hypothetical protein